MSLAVELGVPGSEQESCFMNATLQRAGDVEYSIAVHVWLPAGLSEEEVAARVRGALSLAALRDGVEVRVQVGPAG